MNKCFQQTEWSWSYLCLKVSHRLIKGLWRRPLVVAQDSNRSVCPVVGKQLLCHTVHLYGRWQNRQLHLNRKIPLRMHDQYNARQDNHATTPHTSFAPQGIHVRIKYTQLQVTSLIYSDPCSLYLFFLRSTTHTHTPYNLMPTCRLALTASRNDKNHSSTS